MRGRTILSITSEVFPLIKTGGLADVTGSLPRALQGEGFTVRTLVPGYPAVRAALDRVDTVYAFENLFGGHARLLSSRVDGLELLVLDAPHLYDRAGGPYHRPDGADWPDNALRFAALASVGAKLGQGLVWSFAPELIHCHDWQAGLTPAYLTFSGRPGPPTVVTVHNLAFQGCFPAHLLESLGLPDEAFCIDGVEYHGQIGYLKAGLQMADRITTVSPTYASEICSSEGGMGLDGLLLQREDVLRGILNGIDTETWDPERDPLIPARYGAASLESRGLNKAAVQALFGLPPDPRALLFGVVSRFSWQKGLDLLLQIIPTLAQAGAQLAVVGSGDEDLESAFRAAALRHPGLIGCRLQHEEALAHLVQAGADALLVPSRFEPCGLTQLYALRYGAVPVAARVGGLSDTIIDANPMALASGVATGVLFSPVNESMLRGAVWRAVELYRDVAAWRRVQRTGMATDVSWAASAREHASLFRETISAGRCALRA